MQRQRSKGAHAARPARTHTDPTLAISAKARGDEIAGRPEKTTGRDRVVVVLLAAMTWAKARITANVVEGAQYAATFRVVGGGVGGSLDLPTSTLPL